MRTTPDPGPATSAQGVLGLRGAFGDFGRCLVVAGVMSSCVVSFNDYPVGELSSSASGTGGTAPAAGGSGAEAGAGSSASGGSAGTWSVGEGARGGFGGAGGRGASGGTGPWASGGTDVAAGEAGGEGGASVHEPVHPSSQDLIDDFEDGDDVILDNDGRSGSWIVSNDGTGTQTPGEGETQAPELLFPARGESKRGLHTKGSGFTDWGASVLANLNEEGGDSELYDASRYTGVRFWARSGDGLEHTGRLALPSRETSTFCVKCGDHFGSDFSYSGQWREVRLPFEAMKQTGWGQLRPALEPAELIAVQFLFIDGLKFDLVVDDIGFY